MNKPDTWGKKRAESFAKPASRDMYKAMAKRITADWKNRADSLTFLDLGMGPGWIPIEIKKLFPSASVIGVDPSDAMLRIARDNIDSSGLSGIDITSGQAEKIPVDSGSVDLLLSQFSLHEWEDLDKGFSEIFRVLKPKGTLVIRAWNKSYPTWEFLKHNLRHVFQHGWNRAKEARKSRKRSYPFDTVLGYVEKYDLEPKETEEAVVMFIKAAKR